MAACTLAIIAVFSIVRTPAVALADTTIHFTNGASATLRDDGVIVGTAYIGDWTDTYGEIYPVKLPDETTIEGHCIDHLHYAPAAGNHTFEATPKSDGTYAVIVRSDKGAASSHQPNASVLYDPPQRLGRMSWSPAIRGKARLTKTSALPDITNGNACYQLGEARYGIWTDEACTSGTGSDKDLVTTQDGTSNEVELDPGTYWVKEAQAPAGYSLDTQVYKLVIESGKTTTLNVMDTPLYETPSAWARKTDAQCETAQGSAHLAGAEFTVRYYDGTYDEASLPDTPKRTWILKSDDAGVISPTDESLVGGGAFYRNEQNVALFPLGTVTIQETKAPEGYWLEGQDQDSPAGYAAPIHIAHVDGSGAFQTVGVQDNVRRAGISLRKTDADTESGPQGDASLAGIVFSIINRNDQPVVVNDVTYGPGEVVGQQLKTNEQGYDQTPADCLPMGTYEIVESATNDSMLNTSASQTIVLTPDKTNVVVALGAPMVDEVIRGGIAVGKVSRETNQHITQGEASLAGASFSITLDSAQDVYAYKAMHKQGEVVCTIETNEDGLASTGARDLPYGTYTIREEKAPKGFLLNSDWYQTVEIRDDGEVVDVTSEDESVDDQVMRGGFSFNKVDASTMARMPLVAWRVTSTTTGESHILVTDENGVADTEAIAHTLDTNANDEAVSDGVVQEDKLNPNAGIWFSGRNDGQPTNAQDSLGALPYDVYTVEELPSDVNKNHELVTFSVSIHRHEAHVDMGTIDDIRTASPKIGTTLTHGSDEHVAPATDGLVLTDTVQYEGLVPEEEYTLRGTLQDANTGDAIVDAAGDPVVAETTFKPSVSNGTEKVIFSFDASKCAGTSLVAFEYLMQGDRELTKHRDLRDEGQTVSFPTIGTTLATVDGGHEASMTDRIELVDTVHYENLVPNTRYVVTGTLMDKESKEALHKDNGEHVQASSSFIPEQREGDVEVHFVIDGALVEGKTLVAFETLSCDGDVLTQHEDWNDENQTVHVPSVQTELTTSDKSHVITSTGNLTLVDTVSYSGLESGATYTLEGTLMDKQTNTPIADSDGNDVHAKTSFTAQEETGTTTVEFNVNNAVIEGIETVAFETLSRDDRELYVHADINNEAQTVYGPHIQTTLVSEALTHEVGAVETVLTDIVEYQGLQAGAAYTLVGTLVDKQTGTVLATHDGSALTAQSAFTPESSSGSSEVVFHVDASELAGHDIVAFEYLYQGEPRDDTLVAQHEDINSDAQTVAVPHISTSACNAATKKRQIPETGKVIIRDTVSYEGLTPGATYVMTGTLHGKDSGALLSREMGAHATSSTTFTPESPEGSVEIEFEVRTDALTESGVVVFESCQRDGREVAAHADLTDANQTLTVSRSKKAADKTKEQKESTGKAHTPTTGDRSPILVVIVLAVLGASAIVAQRFLRQ